MASGGCALIRFALRRLLHTVPILVGIVTLIFLLLHLAPGDAATAYFNPNVSPEIIDRMRENLGLDRPIHEQYFRWLRA
ncbi:MAG: hypothetical protein V3W32_10965, partial [Gemmatimonadota bacterium]